jgi:hypothetical protein
MEELSQYIIIIDSLMYIGLDLKIFKKESNEKRESPI